MSEEMSDELYEDDIEEIVIGSDSEDSCEMKVMKPTVQYQRSQADNENDLDYFYGLLQTIIQKTGERPKAFWKPKETIDRAIAVCGELAKEEFALKNDVELLFQENWKLRKRVEIIEKAKKKTKRKTSGVILRRASEASVASKKKIMDSKRRVSMDDSKVGVPHPKIEESSTNKTVNNGGITHKNPKRKSKRHSGMTEEEIEFCTLEEKIEDLLYEVDTLWNEVKDEPDYDEKEDILDIKYTVNTVSEKKIDVSTSHNLVKLEDSPNAKHVGEVNDSKTHKISLKNISKLIDPQFMNQSGQQRVRKVRLVKGGKFSPSKSNKTHSTINSQEMENEQNKLARKTTDVLPAGSQEIDSASKNTTTVKISVLKPKIIETEPEKLIQKTINMQNKSITKTLSKDQTKKREPDIIIISEGSDSESGGF